MEFKSLRKFILLLSVAASASAGASLCDLIVAGNAYVALLVKGADEQIINVSDLDAIVASRYPIDVFAAKRVAPKEVSYKVASRAAVTDPKTSWTAIQSGAGELLALIQTRSLKVKEAREATRLKISPAVFKTIENATGEAALEVDGNQLLIAAVTADGFLRVRDLNDNTNSNIAKFSVQKAFPWHLGWHRDEAGALWLWAAGTVKGSSSVIRKFKLGDDHLTNVELASIRPITGWISIPGKRMIAISNTSSSNFVIDIEGERPESLFVNPGFSPTWVKNEKLAIFKTPNQNVYYDMNMPGLQQLSGLPKTDGAMHQSLFAESNGNILFGYAGHDGEFHFVLENLSQPNDPKIKLRDVYGFMTGPKIFETKDGRLLVAIAHFKDIKGIQVDWLTVFEPRNGNKVIFSKPSPFKLSGMTTINLEIIPGPLDQQLLVVTTPSAAAIIDVMTGGLMAQINAPQTKGWITFEKQNYFSDYDGHDIRIYRTFN